MPDIDLKENIDLWKTCLGGDDPHSISNQLAEMSWDIAVFKVVNEAIGMSGVNSSGETKQNGMVWNLFSTCFFKTQLMTARNLMDVYPLTGTRGVYSLLSVLKDIEKHVALLNRFELIQAVGLEYDHMPRKIAFEKFVAQQHKNGNHVYSVPRECWYEEILNWHKNFDRLSGSVAEDRSKKDQLQTIIIQNLIIKLEKATNKIYEFVNKFIAHKASPGSRKTINADEIEITYNHILNAHKAFLEVANFVSLEICYDGTGALMPTTAFDQFKYLEVPLITTDKLKSVEKVWSEFQSHCDELAYYDLDAYEAEFGNTYS